MFKPGRVILAVLLCGLSLSASAELNLDNNQILKAFNEDPLRVYNERFSYRNALICIDRNNDYLDSFRALTEKARDSLSGQDISSIGHTSWEIQNLGFNNNSLAIEGTVRKQHYQLAMTEYELAQYKFAAGDITEAELNTKREASEQAEADFQKFWDSFRIWD